MGLHEEFWTYGIVRFKQLCSRARSQSISAARQELWWLIRHHPERRYSSLEIARIVDRDPSTVLYGITAHARQNSPCVVS